MYQKRIKEETLKTFIDVPEKIENITVTKSTEKGVKIKWNPPESNNSKITSYKIYLKDCGKFTLIGTSTDPSFELKDLEARSINHVMVRAINQYGEGYEPSRPSLILT